MCKISRQIHLLVLEFRPWNEELCTYLTAVCDYNKHIIANYNFFYKLFFKVNLVINHS